MEERAQRAENERNALRTELLQTREAAQEALEKQREKFAILQETFKERVRSVTVLRLMLTHLIFQ